jgi:hypothetical protein
MMCLVGIQNRIKDLVNQVNLSQETHPVGLESRAFLQDDTMISALGIIKVLYRTQYL